MSLYNRK